MILGWILSFENAFRPGYGPRIVSSRVQKIQNWNRLIAIPGPSSNMFPRSVFELNF